MDATVSSTVRIRSMRSNHPTSVGLSYEVIDRAPISLSASTSASNILWEFSDILNASIRAGWAGETCDGTSVGRRGLWHGYRFAVLSSTSCNSEAANRVRPVVDLSGPSGLAVSTLCSVNAESTRHSSVPEF